MSNGDWDKFDTEEYVSRCYGKQILDVDRAIIQDVKAAMESLGLQPGTWSRAADVGAGPNLFPAMLLAPFMIPNEQGGRLELIENSAPNLEYLADVLGDVDRPSGSTRIWGKYEKLIAEDSSLWSQAFSDLKSVAAVTEGSVYDLPADTYDAISAYFVAESITDSRVECERAVARLVDAVKSGGFIMVGHMLGSLGYNTGVDGRYPAVPLSLTDLRDLYEGVLEEPIILEAPRTREIRDDFQGAAVVIGKKLREPARTVTDHKRYFTSFDTQACLYDQRRVMHFKQALFEVIKPGDVVVDGGSGTGVLGMIAVQAGASKAYCVELNEEYAEVISRNAKKNDMEEKIVVINADSTTVNLPEKVDVIVSEAISGGFFYEPQLQIVTHLKRFLKPSGSIVPMVVDHFVELIAAQDELYGLEFSFDTRHQALDDTELTTKSNYLHTDFYQETPFAVSSSVRVRCMTSGIANAIKISYTVGFSSGTLATEPTEFLLNPQIIFLRNPLQLVAGSYYTISLDYETAASPLDCRVEVEEFQGRVVANDLEPTV